MFIISLNYTSPLDEVKKHLPAPFAFRGTYIASGGSVRAGRKGPWPGGVLVLDVPDEKRARGMAEDDPFFRNKVSGFVIIGFLPDKFGERYRAAFIGK